jgi:hypothetical protein
VGRNEFFSLMWMEKTKYMFMSRHQTAGQSNYIKVANKSFEKSGKVQVFGSNINGPKLHS